MLSYNDQYNILAGIWTVFHNKNPKKRALSVSHGKAKRDKMKKIFPYNQYENYTKENFIISVLYIMFTKKSSSLIATVQELKDLSEKDAMKFKNEIIHYRKYLLDDIERIKIEDGNNIPFETIKEKYRNNEIKWFTFYFYIIVKGVDIVELENSRIDGFLYNNIKKLLLYVTFSEKSIMEIKQVMQDTIEI